LAASARLISRRRAPPAAAAPSSRRFFGPSASESQANVHTNMYTGHWATGPDLTLGNCRRLSGKPARCRSHWHNLEAAGLPASVRQASH
jgi:hypothetical protein